MEATYALVNCETEWILLSSLKDYDQLHSLASIRRFRTRNDSWEVRPPYGSNVMFLFAADSPLTAAKQYLASMGMSGNIEIYN